MEQRNEPTTAEIVRDLQQCSTRFCEDTCTRYYTHEHGDTCAYTLMADASARLEQLERENAEKDETIAALTARAEKAEADRDAAVADLEYGMGCTTCKHRPLPLSKKPCKYCMEINYRGNYEWRGLRGKGNA